MAKTKNINNDNKAKSRRNLLWKGIALAALVIFGIIVITGVVRMYHHRPDCRSAQQSEMDFANETALSAMSSLGEDVSLYDMKIRPEIRTFEKDGVRKNIIQVSFYSGMFSKGGLQVYLFLIDADTGLVVMHSKTKFYDEGFMPPIPGDDFQEKRGLLPPILGRYNGRCGN